MGFFSSKIRRKGQFYLALDIGTDVVKALICSSEGAKGKILGVGRRKQKLGDMQSGVVLDIGSVIHNCQEAIRDAEKMAGVKPEQMVMGIAGELVKGATTTTTYTRKDPDSKIDLAELKNIVHKVQWKAFDQVRSQLAYETGYNEIDVKLVNAAIVDMRIDGYRVNNPIGFQGRDVVMSVFNAFAPLVHYGALQTIAAELGVDLITVMAEPYALSRCLRDEEGGGQVNAIFLDIGGGTTDIAVVRNGRLEGTKMFTLGGRTFTKRLCHSLNVSFDDAEDIKLMYSYEGLERHSEKIVRDAMKSDSEVWLSGIILTLSEFGLDLLPSRILLCGGGSRLPEIKEILETREWVKNLPFSKKPQIDFMLPKMVSQMTDDTKTLREPQDVTPLALARLGLDYVGEEHVLTSLLKKVVRLMDI
ncbi:MAG: cell division FtsA domain-containing protein [Patescibacteria group bacterium]